MNGRVWCVLAAAAAAGCSDDGVGPRRPDPAAAVSVAYLDVQGHLHVVRSGGQPASTPTALSNVLPFAPGDRRIVVLAATGMRVFHLDGRVDALPVPPTPAQTFGALSPDQSRIAYGSLGPENTVFLHTVVLATGARDSIDVTRHGFGASARQIIQPGNTPVWSPSGDTIAFLLPNPIGMQVFLYDMTIGRIDIFPIPIRVATFATPIGGWPRWLPDGSIRFVALRHENGEPSDTIMAMRLFPSDPNRPAEVLFQAHPPDGLPLDAAGAYSFDRTGSTVAFLIQSHERAGAQIRDRLGIFLMRRGSPVLEALVYGPGVTPRFPLLIP